MNDWQTQWSALAQDASVIACYDFQEGRGDVLHNRAATGAKFDGKIKNAEWTSGRWPGKHAVEFSGRRSLIAIPPMPEFNPSAAPDRKPFELTLDLWVKVRDLREAGLIDKSSHGNGYETPYGLWLAGNRLLAFTNAPRGTPTGSAADTAFMPVGKWTHVALVITPDSLTLYRDGAVAAQAKRQGSLQGNDKPLLLGGMGEIREGLYYFNGAMDEFVIHSKALSAEKIRERSALRPPEGPQLVSAAMAERIELIEPLGGEVWAADSGHFIRWQTKGENLFGDLTVEVSFDDGKTWTAVGTEEVKAGQRAWRVPAQVSSKCRVRLLGAGGKTLAQSPAPFSTVASQEAPGYEWVNLTMNAPFAPRDGLGILSYRNKLWLLGGWNPSDPANFPVVCNNEVWSSDGAKWTLVKPNTLKDKTFDPASDWEGRHTAGWVVFKDKMWIVGGDAIQGHYQNDVWNSTDGVKWTCVARDVPWRPRVLHHTVVFKDRIWVMGGQTLPQFAREEPKVYRDIWSSTDGVNWEKAEAKEPYWSPRGMIGGSAVFKGRMWVLGGGTYDMAGKPERDYYNDVWSTDDGVHWQCHTAVAPWAPRQYHDVAVFDDKLWVMEGYLFSNRNDVWYSSDGMNWYEVPNTPWKPRHAAGIAVHDNALWMIAGNNMESDVWKLVRRGTPK